MGYHLTIKTTQNNDKIFRKIKYSTVIAKVSNYIIKAMKQGILCHHYVITRMCISKYKDLEI